MSIVGVIGAVLTTGKPQRFIETLAPYINGSPIPTNTTEVMDKLNKASSFFDLSSANIVDIVDFVVTILLGIAAAYIAAKANAINERAIKQSEITQEHEKEMRKLENKISVIDKAFEIYFFFTEKANHLKYYLYISSDNYAEKFSEAGRILYISRFIFSDKVYSIIAKEYKNVIDSIYIASTHSLLHGRLDITISSPHTEEEIENNKIIDQIEVNIKNTRSNIIKAFEEYRLNL